MIIKMAGDPKWRKILYEDQGVPDNYVDRSFLDELKKNCKLAMEGASCLPPPWNFAFALYNFRFI